MKRKNLFVLALALILVAALLMTGCSKNTAGDKASSANAAGKDLPKVQLSLTTHDPETASAALAIKAWAEDISKKTNGGLTIKIFASGSL
jgi:TRAP-type C4-dicarboxylate transport system substrate-binding protein